MLRRMPPPLSAHPTHLHSFSVVLNSRTWETYSQSVGVDASCGASGILLRLLAMPLPEGVTAVRQERTKQDLTLQSKSTEDLLNPSLMPIYMQQLVVRK